MAREHEDYTEHGTAPCVPHEQPTEQVGPQTAPRGWVLDLQSGRRVSVAEGAAPGRERLEVRSPAGAVELRVEFTDKGPVLTFSGAEVVLASPGTLRIEAERVAIDGRAGVSVRSAGEIATESQGATWVNGKTINLNCDRDALPSHNPVY